MSMRTLTIILAALALFLSLSWWARSHLAAQRCEERGLVYVPGQGCVEPRKSPPVILERGLTRT
ncbi:MAG: hypothetical protein AB7U75_16635 [Hyphomicrobiaceae bacterium]